MGYFNYSIYSEKIALLIILMMVSFGGCGGIGTEPIALPVPFSGNLTPETNVLVSEGNPLGGLNFSFDPANKNQSVSQGQFPLTWNLFDSTSGVLNGTFSLNSRSDPQCSEIPNVGIRCTFTADACATIDPNREACSSTFEVFDYPTDYDPPQDLIDYCSGIPGTTAKIRKLLGSGNINLNDPRNREVVAGQLLDGKLIIGSCCFPGDQECFYRTQLESAVSVHGTEVDPLQRSPDGQVVFSMITQGGALPHPVPEDPFGIMLPVLFPGSDQPAGTMFGITVDAQTIPPGIPPDQAEAMDTTVDSEFQLNDSQNSRLVVHNVRILTHRIPELDQPIREVLQTDYSDAPGVTPRMLSEGVFLWNSAEESTSDPINCDPSAGEATGVFQDLCMEFGTLRVTFLCTVMTVLTPPPVIDTFMFTGVWSIIRE